jgi:hypothetical protein
MFSEEFAARPAETFARASPAIESRRGPPRAAAWVGSLLLICFIRFLVDTVFGYSLFAVPIRPGIRYRLAAAAVLAPPMAFFSTRRRVFRKVR